MNSVKAPLGSRWGCAGLEGPTTHAEVDFQDRCTLGIIQVDGIRHVPLITAQSKASALVALQHDPSMQSLSLRLARFSRLEKVGSVLYILFTVWTQHTQPISYGQVAWHGGIRHADQLCANGLSLAAV